MNSTMPILTLIAIYRWILVFATPCFVKPKFRAISNVHSQRALLDPCLHWLEHSFFNLTSFPFSNERDLKLDSYANLCKYDSQIFLISSSSCKLAIEAQVVSIFPLYFNVWIFYQN